MKDRYLFSEITKRKQFILQRYKHIRNLWIVRMLLIFIFLLFFILWYHYGNRKYTSFFFWTIICWIPLFLWNEIISYGDAIKDYSFIGITTSYIIIEKLSRFSWKVKEMRISPNHIQKIVIDGKDGQIIIFGKDWTLRVKKRKKYLQTQIFLTNKIDEFVSALKKLQIKYEVIYP